MMESETSQEPDELYVPTPEELEQGIEPAARKRRKSRPEEASSRRKLSELARRLFRLRPGVGRERSEAPAPIPLPATPDRSPPPPSVHPSSPRKADDASIPQSTSAVPQPSEKRQSRDQGTTLPQSVKPDDNPRSSAAKTSEQRLRRVTVPVRTPRRPIKKQVIPSPVPEWVLEKASQKGHQLAPFQEQRRAMAFEHDQRYVSGCVNCNVSAYAVRSADHNWTVKDASWQTQGSAFEKSCPGSS